MRRRAAPAKGKRKGKARTKRLRFLGRWQFPFRWRLSVVAALAFAAAVLATSMPVEALLTQRHQLHSTTSALAQAQAADRSLSAQVKALSNPDTVDDLARADYGLVASGQRAYVILPPEGASATAVTGSGHVPLEEPPVVPGSALSRQLLGLSSVPAGSGGEAKALSSSPSDGGERASAPVSGDPGGFWSRVVRTLEFWR